MNSELSSHIIKEVSQTIEPAASGKFSIILLLISLTLFTNLFLALFQFQAIFPEVLTNLNDMVTELEKCNTPSEAGFKSTMTISLIH